ncbi:MAG TPA: hypothetical protein VIG34_11185 [Xanthobacteraceae bacterium]|jgi:hypothetical protein
MTALKLAAVVAAALVATHGAFAQPVPIDKRHAYEGSRRTAAQVATVYGKIVTNLASLSRPLTMTMIHNVDGKSVRGMFESACCSVVYVLPGRHQILVHYSVGNRYGSGTVTTNFAAGRVYEVEAVEGGDKVAFRLREAGSVLTYKDVMPTPYASGSRVNSRIDPN